MVNAYRPLVDALCTHFGDRLRSVVLFGSQARGEASPGSDHDVFVVANDLPRDPLARARELGRLLLPILSALPGPISFIARTPEELMANLSPLTIDVCADGVCLYGDAFFEPLRQKALAALEAAGLSRRRVGGTLMWVFSHARTSDWTLDWDGFHDGV
jgi:hypothetical protein